MADDILLTAQGISRAYGPHPALCGIELTLRRGEVLGLLGLNGAGKSTALQIFAGVMPPDAGRVAICDHDVIEDPRAAKRQLGFLPEVPPLHPDASVDEYLTFCARLHGLASAAVADGVREAKRRCRLEDVGGRLIRNLSKGYRQRLGIAQAILHKPALLILDEPTSGLDPVQLAEVRTLVRELGRDHSVIFSTHILSEVRAVCDRVAILHRGRIVCDQPLASVDPVLRIRLRRAPGRAIIAALEGVLDCEDLGAGTFALRVADADATAERIAAAARDWGLVALEHDENALERTFLALTCRDDTPDATADAA
ncbi:MAG: ATP-binding cassette domain-containing protein [Gammaproteobacteria bacterium]|nr:ATP-binding cassette domain-containing protein [Gammaproteobacteria bacterium]